MGTTTFNGVKVPVGSDPYQLTADVKTAAETTNAVIVVTSQAQRDALPKTEGLVCLRLDLGGRLEFYYSGQWRFNYNGPFAMASGSFMASLTGATTDLTGLALPDGRFTVPPLMVATSGSEVYGVFVAPRSTSTTRWNARIGNGAAGVTVPINWIAIQMTPTSAQDIIL